MASLTGAPAKATSLRTAPFDPCAGQTRALKPLVPPWVLTATAVMAGAAWSSAALAAPQALGVVASIAPVEMTCTGETCTAQLSAFCLQRERDTPAAGTAYRAAEPGAFSLKAIRADGSTVAIALDERVAFSSAFGYASVRVSAPAALLAEWDAASLAIEVSETAALIPAPVAGDPDPQSEAEIALATGPLRALASRHFDAPSTARDAAHLIEAVVNGLPAQSWEGSVDRESLWPKQVTAELKAAASPDAVALARSVYDNCLPGSYSMRQCLELKHMNLLSDANRAYWDEASPGS